MRFSQHSPVLGFESGLFSQLALGGAQRFFAFRAAARRNLPGVLLERVAVLPDEIHLVVLDRQNAGGDVFEVYDAVDTRLLIGTDDSILAHGDPRIIVDLPRRYGFPRALHLI